MDAERETPEREMAALETHLEDQRGRLAGLIDKVEALGRLWALLLELAERRGQAVTLRELVADGQAKDGARGRAEIEALIERATRTEEDY